MGLLEAISASKVRPLIGTSEQSVATNFVGNVVFFENILIPPMQPRWRTYAWSVSGSPDRRPCNQNKPFRDLRINSRDYQWFSVFKRDQVPQDLENCGAPRDGVSSSRRRQVEPAVECVSGRFVAVTLLRIRRAEVPCESVEASEPLLLALRRSMSAVNVVYAHSI